VHAPLLPVENQIVRLSFSYSSTDNVVRQWRHKLVITSISLIQTDIQVLDSTDGLCALRVRNMITSRDSILAQIECLKLEAKLISPLGFFVDLNALSNRSGEF
jgi:hypothetical protein